MLQYSKTSRAARLPPWAGMTSGFGAFTAVYSLAAIAYAMYSIGAESGLYGYVMILEMDTIGMAEKTITALLTFGVLFAPFGAIIWIAGNLAPSLVWAPGPPKSGLMERLNQPVRSVSWRMIFLVTAIPILAGVLICPVLYHSEQRDQNQKIYPIDLTSGGGDPAKDAKFAQVTGLMARQYALSFKRTFNTVTKSHEMFAPLTGNAWTHADPVRYFVRVESYEDGQGKVEWPVELRQSGPARFSGKISRSLPAYVESEFRSKGLKIGPSPCPPAAIHSLLRTRGVPPTHRVPRRQSPSRSVN
ncbi:membrane hypothetical protein [Candidatus Sulfopaludibacter sp. SbA4]|nr:membrane hypothetical protein [Candidatus Sulfopaludibacter sp. SbA4]